jgi:hypothetical protein
MRFICWLLTVICPVTLMAQEANPAMLQVKGSVTVNGSSVQSSSVIYSGDKIETGDDSSANITQQGSVISVASNSRVVYDKGIVRLERGELIVGTQSQYHGRIKNLTVTPPSKRARYRMVIGLCEIRITALEGSVMVDDQKDTALLRKDRTIRKVNKSDLKVRAEEGQEDKEAALEELSAQQPPSTLLPPSPTDKDHSESGKGCPALLLPPPGPEPGVAATAARSIPPWVWVAGAAGGTAAAAGVLLGGSGPAPITPSVP